MAKAVKLADIAQKVGVSTVTVSKALSGQKGVSDEVRLRIQRLAEEMGYVSLSVSKMQNTRKTYNIGVIISERYCDQRESFYWQMYQEVATRAVTKESFTLLEILKFKDENDLNMPKLLTENKVDGLIIIGLLKEEYFHMLIDNIRVPYVCLDFYDKKHECDCVVTDNYYGMYKLTNYLFDMGHTKIAYVGTLCYTSSITDRYFGYHKSMLEHGQKIPDEWVIDDRYFESGDRDEAFEFKIPEDNMPTAFVCNCDLTADVLIGVLREKGYEVPTDISIVGFDNYIIQNNAGFGITTYEVDVKEMVRNTISTLLKKVCGEHYKKGITTVEGRMVIKESVKDLR